MVLGYLFLGQMDALTCKEGADVDDSGGIEISDPIYLLDHLFLGGPPPEAPYPDCGEDPTPDALDCSSPACPTRSTPEKPVTGR